MLQLDFFEKDQITSLRNDFILVKESSDKVRRGVFARLNALEHQFNLLSQRMSYIESYICKNEKPEPCVSMEPEKKSRKQKNLTRNEDEKDLFDFNFIDIKLKVS